jgi:hypothetical protein
MIEYVPVRLDTLPEAILCSILGPRFSTIATRLVAGFVCRELQRIGRLLRAQSAANRFRPRFWDPFLAAFKTERHIVNLIAAGGSVNLLQWAIYDMGYSWDVGKLSLYAGYSNSIAMLSEVRDLLQMFRSDLTHDVLCGSLLMANYSVLSWILTYVIGVAFPLDLKYLELAARGGSTLCFDLMFERIAMCPSCKVRVAPLGGGKSSARMTVPCFCAVQYIPGRFTRDIEAAVRVAALSGHTQIIASVEQKFGQAFEFYPNVPNEQFLRRIVRVALCGYAYGGFFGAFYQLSARGWAAETCWIEGAIRGLADHGKSRAGSMAILRYVLEGRKKELFCVNSRAMFDLALAIPDEALCVDVMRRLLMALGKPTGTFKYPAIHSAMMRKCVGPWCISNGLIARIHGDTKFLCKS